LVLHVSADSFFADTRDPARLEHAGHPSVPLTTEQAADLLGHSRVGIQPVIDLNDTTPVDAYEVTGQLRQKVTIMSAGVCPFRTATCSADTASVTTPSTGRTGRQRSGICRFPTRAITG
jgi:hypothetical protein